MRILLVADQSKNTAHLRKGLLENGFAVDLADSRGVAGDPSRRPEYDLCVCDGVPNPAQLQDLRRGRQQAPVVFVSAREPFTDFLSRVRSLLQFGNAQAMDSRQIADLEIDLIRHRATRAGRRLDLTPKEFLLLSLLMRHAGEVLSRTVIADQVWEINFESNTNFVDVHIRRLRSKEDDPFEKKLIHTVRGMGYVLEER